MTPIHQAPPEVSAKQWFAALAGDTASTNPSGLYFVHGPAYGSVDRTVAFHKDDARLFAAAPNLLKELTHLVRLLEPALSDGRISVPGLATLNGAKAAIAKAQS